MNRARWILVISLVVFVSCVVSSVPPNAPPGISRPTGRMAAPRTPHEIVLILEEPYLGKVEADLTGKEIIITNIQRAGSLILKLFKDFVKVPASTFIYRDPARVPLEELSLYLVSVSSEDGFAMAAFQLVKGNLHIVRLD